MFARLPREMLAAVTRDLNVPVGTNVIVEALNYASAQLAGYYSWPWLTSEFTWTFRSPLSGTCTVSTSGVFTFTSVSDPNWDQYVDKNWRIMVGQHDYPVFTMDAPGGGVKTDTTKVRVIPAADPVNFRLFHSSLVVPSDYRPGSDFACYNTTLRYRIRHVNRMSFERHWHAYKQMATNNALIFTDAEPYYDAGEGRWLYQLQFCPPVSATTQVRVTYQRVPKPIDLTTNLPTEWPQGYDEIIELIATGRIGEKTGDAKAISASRRARGLIRQLRGGIATAVVDDTPVQNTPFSNASWEDGNLSVLPRES